MLAVSPLMGMAKDIPQMRIVHDRSVDEPYVEYEFTFSSLKGWDNYLHWHHFYFGKKNGDKIINPTYMQNSAQFDSQRNEHEPDQRNLNIVLSGPRDKHPNDDYHIVLIFKQGGGYDRVAIVRVYKRKDPMGEFSVRLYCKWQYNGGNDTYNRWLDFKEESKVRDQIIAMQMKQKESKVYFVSPTTLVIEPQFNNSRFSRDFDVSSTNNPNGPRISGRTRFSETGKYQINVDEKAGIYAIDHPYKFELVENIAVSPYSTQTIDSKIFETKKYAHPTDLTYTTDQYQKSVTLSWKKKKQDDDNIDAAYQGKWYVYRRKQDESDWKYLASVNDNQQDTDFKYEDKSGIDRIGPDFNTPYEYTVCFIPNYWLMDYGKGGTIDILRYQPINEFSERIANVRVETQTPFVQTPQVFPLEESIKVVWEHKVVPQKTFSDTETVFYVDRMASTSNVWETVATVKPYYQNEATQNVTDSIIDTKDIASSCTTYQYRIRFNRGDGVAPYTSSTSSSARINGKTKVVAVTASTGDFPNECLVRWTAEQRSVSETIYRVKRRDIHDDALPSTIHTTQGTATEYSYLDVTCEPGKFYEYTVEAYTECEGQDVASNGLTAIGFSQMLATINGKVTYGSGDAVDSVRVSIKAQQDSEGNTATYHSAHFSAESNGLQVNCDKENGLKLNNDNYTIAAWVKPDSTKAGIFTVSGKNGNHLHTYLDDNKIYLHTSDAGASGEGLGLNHDAWQFVFLRQENAKITYGIIDRDRKIHQKTAAQHHAPDSMKVFAVAMQRCDASMGIAAADAISQHAGAVSVDEVRVYNRVLTDNDLLRSYDRMLSGKEKDLMLYWPINEGVQTGYVYDMSGPDGNRNNANGRIKRGMTYSKDSPNQTEQVSSYGLTSTDGTYIISGIPFAGGGTNYSITPSKGTHAFSYPKQTRYVNKESLVHSGVDFRDISSFPVSGTIRYAGTTIPVDSCVFEVDGVICMHDGQPVMSDAEGKYTISVPIGDHQITIKRDKHVFVNDGKYPAGTGTHTFVGPTYNLDFVDNTLVNFTGRFVGGFRDQNKPLAFGKSVNNIGKVTFTLTPTANRGLLNAKKTVTGTSYSYDPNDKPVAVASDTTSIKSYSYRGGGSVEECQKIYITTDSLTGEFSALIPPLKYKMSEQKLSNKNDVIVGSGSIIDLDDFTFANADTLFVVSDSVKQTRSVSGIYKYHYKLIGDYHNTPVFKVNEGKPFGIDKYEHADADGLYTINNIYTVNGTNITYNYGYPLFEFGKQYLFPLEAYETYVNVDSKEAKPDKQPLSGCFVKIANTMSSTQVMVMKRQTDKEGKVYEPGTPVGDNTLGIYLDSLGKGTYVWCAGLPNVNPATNHALSLTMHLAISGKEYAWIPSDNTGLKKAGTKDGEGMMGIVLGSVMMGRDFVTKAPVSPTMVLRDPPGAHSMTTLKKGSSYINNTETSISHSGKFDGTLTKSIGTSLIFIDKLKIQGVSAGDYYESSSQASGTLGVNLQMGRYWGDIVNQVFTFNEDVSTSSDSEYVGSWGDVYIGKSSNWIFGDAREVYIPRSSKTVSVHDTKSVQDSVTTTFVYTQAEILRNTIPGYKREIKNMLKDTYGKQRLTREQVTVPHYYSNLPEDHPNFGLSNFDKVFGGAEVKDGSGPSYAVVFPKTGQYQDTIQYLHNQINAWENVIRQNEAEKVAMYEKRNIKSEVEMKSISFSGGTTVTESMNKTDEVSHATSNDFNIDVNLVYSSLNNIFNQGISFKAGPGYVFKKNETSMDVDQNTTNIVYTLMDNDFANHTIDVYRGKKEDGKSSNGWGPIFRTLAGRTYGPYEDGDTTRYYPGRHEIMAKTLQMEVPQLVIDQPLQSNVPNGGAASFKIKMSNQSSTGTNHYFLLTYGSTENKGNAKITVDGKSILDPLKIYIPYNTTIEKTVVLTQTDKTILDYENIPIVLLSTTQNDAASHWPAIQSSVPISANFVPVSTNVTLQVDKNVLTTSTDTTLVFTISDFDIHHEGLKNVQLQYRFVNEEWTTLQTWVTDTKTYPQYPSLAEEAAKYQGLIKYSLKMKDYADGNYTFRVVSVTQYGTDGEVTKESEEMKVVKDTKRPVLIAMPTPADGILGIGDVISAEFNEDIASGKITQDGNIEVYGTLTESTDKVYSIGIAGQGVASEASMTQSRIDLRDMPFTIELWAKSNCNGQYDQISLLHGTSDNQLAMCLNNYPSVVINGRDNSTQAPTKKTLKAQEAVGCKDDQWVFWQLSYKPRNRQQANSKNTLSLTAYYGNQNKVVFKDEEVPDILCNGQLTVSPTSVGQYADLAIWDYVRGPEKAAQGMQRKSGLEDGLSYYWKFDEGHGSVAEDLVGGNHFRVNDHAWYIDNTNFAAHITQDKLLAIPMGDSNLSDDDSYALEFWFKPSQNASGSTEMPIMHTNNGTVSMTAQKDGRLALNTNLAGDKQSYQSVGTFNYDWHHVLMSIQRGISATVYVDGTSQMMLREKQVPGLGCDSIYFGSGFTGDIDEVRIWKGLYSTQHLLDNSYSMVDTASVKGLVRYYPFENTYLDSANQKVTVFSPHNAAVPNDITQNDMQGTMVKASTVPPLKDAVKRTNLPYVFTAADRKVSITIDSEMIKKLEKTTVNISLKNIPDINGNSSDRISWNAYVRQSPLRWQRETLHDIQVKPDLGREFENSITNYGSEMVSWMLRLPSWLSAEPSFGLLSPQATTSITFTVNDDVATGYKISDVEVVNLNNNMTERFPVSIHVTGKEPAWFVDESDKQFVLPVTARLLMNNAYSEDESDLLAAFIDGECVGVSNVALNSQRNNYFVNMNIYGSNRHFGKKILFKAWDADHGVVYAPLLRQKGDSIIFTENQQPFGSYTDPEILCGGNQVEQAIDLDEGWNWISFFVNTGKLTLNDAMKFANGKIKTVKTQKYGAEWNANPDSSGNPTGFTGKGLQYLNEPSMYAIYATEPIAFTVGGTLWKDNEGQQTIKKGWTWLRNPYVTNRSVSAAFSDMTPMADDVVQTRDVYAQWSATYNRWEGMMTNLAPGKGYKYFSGSPTAKTVFGNMDTQSTRRAKRSAQEGEDSEGSDYPYADNMLVLAKLVLSDAANYSADDVIVSATNSDHQTFETLPDKGYYVLTVSGADNAAFSFNAIVDGKCRTLYAFQENEDKTMQETTITFTADATVGTFDSPIILSDNRNVTSIRELSYDSIRDDGNYDVYTLQGLLMISGKHNGAQVRRLPQGIYIINGNQVILSK